jgi:hypothetical protein
MCQETERNGVSVEVRNRVALALLGTQIPPRNLHVGQAITIGDIRMGWEDQND